jgi:hypothetical protein
VLTTSAAPPRRAGASSRHARVRAGLDAVGTSDLLHHQTSESDAHRHPAPRPQQRPAVRELLILNAVRLWVNACPCATSRTRRPGRLSKSLSAWRRRCVVDAVADLVHSAASLTQFNTTVTLHERASWDRTLYDDYRGFPDHFPAHAQAARLRPVMERLEVELLDVMQRKDDIDRRVCTAQREHTCLNATTTTTTTSTSTPPRPRCGFPPASAHWLWSCKQPRGGGQDRQPYPLLAALLHAARCVLQCVRPRTILHSFVLVVHAA